MSVNLPPNEWKYYVHRPLVAELFAMSTTLLLLLFCFFFKLLILLDLHAQYEISYHTM